MSTAKPNPYLQTTGESWEKYLAAYERLQAAKDPLDVQAAEKDIVHYRAMIALPNIIKAEGKETNR